jgi:hypothetical protein
VTPTLSHIYLPLNSASNISWTEGNDLHRKDVGRHSNFPMGAEAKREKLINASTTSDAYP